MDQETRLIELLESVPTDPEGNRNVAVIAKHLIANGVIVPPCKVGQTVFIIDDYDCDPYVMSVKVEHIKSDRLGEWIGLRYPLGMKYSPIIPIEDIGKKIFLTEAEAEKHLQKGADNEQREAD